MWTLVHLFKKILSNQCSDFPPAVLIVFLHRLFIQQTLVRMRSGREYILYMRVKEQHLYSYIFYRRSLVQLIRTFIYMYVFIYNYISLSTFCRVHEVNCNNMFSDMLESVEFNISAALKKWPSFKVEKDFKMWKWTQMKGWLNYNNKINSALSH